MSGSKTRVLFVNSPLIGGADTWIHYLVLANLDATRFERYAAGQPPKPGLPSPAFDDLERIAGVTIRPTDFGPTFFGRALAERIRGATAFLPAMMSVLELARYIRRERIQILHSTDRPRDAMACALLASITGAKSVIHAHVKFDTWMGRGVRWAFARADALVGVSEFVGRSLAAGGYRRERIHAVLNAIDPSAWNPRLDRAPGRRTLGVEAGAPLIVSVARLFHWKGHGELIRAVALVKRDLPDVRLAVVGADYPAGSGVSSELRAQAASLGVAENVIFPGHRNDVAALLAASDVFALPSFEEPFGLVFAEAMAMERPVVALDNGGTPEVVRHGETGLLSPPGDIPALASNLVALLRDPSRRAAMGKLGRADVETRFTPARLARDVEKVYAAVLSAR